MIYAKTLTCGWYLFFCTIWHWAFFFNTNILILDTIYLIATKIWILTKSCPCMSIVYSPSLPLYCLKLFIHFLSFYSCLAHVFLHRTKNSDTASQFHIKRSWKFLSCRLTLVLEWFFNWEKQSLFYIRIDCYL